MNKKSEFKDSLLYIQICHISKDLVKSLRLNTKYWLWGLLGIQMRVTDGPSVPQGEGG